MKTTIATAADATTAFSELNKASDAQHETKDCSVKALAIVASVDYTAAHAALKQQGRKNRKGCSTHQINRAAIALGCVVVQIDKPAAAKTMKTVGPALLASGQPGAHLIYMRGHVAAVVAGQVADWTRGRRHRVSSIFRITPPTQPTPAVTETDNWGTRLGTKAARINRAITHSPQTMKQLMAAAGVDQPFRNHLKKMIAAGHVKKVTKTMKLEDAPLSGSVPNGASGNWVGYVLVLGWSWSAGK